MANIDCKPIPQLSQKDIDRFWSKVNKTEGLGPKGDCWEWTGGTNYRGYGQFYRRIADRDCNFRASRISYLLTYGEDPFPFQMLHSCDWPVCVRGSHLSKGTGKDNMQDAAAKGRMTSGDKHWARLHPEKVKRGADHPHVKHPERLKRGDESWSRQHPERLHRIYDEDLKKEIVARVVEEFEGNPKLSLRDIAIDLAMNWSTLRCMVDEYRFLLPPAIDELLKQKFTRTGDHNPSRQKPERLQRGDNHHGSKVSSDSVREIRRLFDSKTLNQMELSRKFGVSQPTISQIVLRRTWIGVEPKP